MRRRAKEIKDRGRECRGKMKERGVGGMIVKGNDNADKREKKERVILIHVCRNYCRHA